MFQQPLEGRRLNGAAYAGWEDYTALLFPAGGPWGSSASPLLLVFKSFPSIFSVSTRVASKAPGVVGKKHEKRGAHPESATSLA